MKQVPGGAQNFWEWLVESLYDFLEGHHWPAPGQADVLVLRHHLHLHSRPPTGSASFPASARSGGDIRPPQGFKIDQPLFRGANADLNLTLAMALVFFACWIVWALQEVGAAWVPARSCSRPRARAPALLKVLMVVVFFAVGCLEIISILFRPVSLSFRLYGNIFAGENMLETMAKLVPGLGWLLPIPFYFLELLVGLVQALVFMLLTAVFTLLICQHEEEGPRGRARLNERSRRPDRVESREPASSKERRTACMQMLAK